MVSGVQNGHCVRDTVEFKSSYPSHNLRDDVLVGTEPEATHSDWRRRLGEMEVPESISSNDVLNRCLGILVRGGRVSEDDGMRLMQENSLSALSSLADMIKRSHHGNDVYFNENLHVNTTNICILACRFCAFRKGVNHPDAYALSPSDFLDRMEPFSNTIDEVHSVGGLHPTWKVEDYAELFSTIKEAYPHIHIKSLTAIEIIHVSRRSGITVEAALEVLSRAGLGSIPGGGAEILVDSVRDRICRGKESSDEYLEVHGTAHELGIPTNCTMLFGTVETVGDRIRHLNRLREQQDRSGGFQCFVPYPFLSDSSRLPDAQLASSSEVIRMIAVSRILLDNIPHIKAYRMNLGNHLAALCLNAGADDIDGTVSHEEIMHEAGSSTRLDTSTDELARLIASSGARAVKRDSLYREFRSHDMGAPRSVELPVLGNRG